LVFTKPASIARYDIEAIATADAIAILVNSDCCIKKTCRAHSCPAHR
jgi:hypothetical protein